MTAFFPNVEMLATPLIWSDHQGRILGVNAALTRWLGIGARRLQGQPLIALELQGETLMRALEQPDPDMLHLCQLTLGMSGEEPRVADGWLSHWEEGWLLEVHPRDDHAIDDPAGTMPSALSASLKGLAHELRNPLAGLKGATQLLARRMSQKRDVEALELIELIRSEIERLNQLLERLMSAAPLRPHEPVNIHAVLERVLRLAQTEGGWNLHVQRDYDPSIPEFPGDPDRLTQAVWNLIRNANEAGATTITLRTRVESGIHSRGGARGPVVRLEIIDDGRGVPETLTEHLFLPLVSGRADGTGLGLALTYQVAREHRGILAFRSRPGHTTFTLTLAPPPGEPSEGL